MSLEGFAFLTKINSSICPCPDNVDVVAFECAKMSLLSSKRLIAAISKTLSQSNSENRNFDELRKKALKIAELNKLLSEELKTVLGYLAEAELDSPTDVEEESDESIEDSVPTNVHTIINNVKVSMIESPSKFWFQDCVADTVMANLMRSIQKVYSSRNDMIIAKDDLRSGLIVAAGFNGTWYRAKIVEVLEENVRVDFIDYGKVKIINNSDIQYLLEDFLSEPAKALQGKLSGIVPKQGDQWSYDSTSSFYDRVANKKLFAVIKQHKDDVFEIEIREQESSMTSISEYLVFQGLAVREENLINKS
jgi:hypothetical protein